MEESQGVDINEVAMDNIVPLETGSDGNPVAPAAPDLPTNNETSPAEPMTPEQTAPAQVDPATPPEADPQQPEAEGTGTIDDPIKIDTTEQQPGEEPGTEPGEEPESQPEGDFEEDEQYEIFNEHLFHYTDGAIQSIEDVNNMMEELETLRNQPKQPEFTSESAKKLFEFAQNSSNPLAMGKNYLHAVSLDVETLSDKQKMFEAFVLDEQNSDLTREDALEIFNEEYVEQHGEAEDSVVGKRRLQLAVRNAEEKIKSVQGEAMEAKSKDAGASGEVSPEVMEEIYSSIDESLTDVNALSIPGGDDVDFNFDISDPNDREHFSSATKDPMGWLQAQINTFQDQRTGKFDYDGYNAFIGSLVFSGKIAEGMFKHGQNNGTRTMVESLQNPQKPGSSPQAPARDGRTQEEKVWETLAEKMANF